MKSKNINFKILAIISISLFLVVFLAIVGFGIFRAWYLSTGFREVNHPSFKAQETITKPADANIIDIKGLEPDVSTRFISRKLSNPIAPNTESLMEGKELFSIYCSPCHGKNGEGLGIMGSVPILARAPANEEGSLKKYLSGFIGYAPSIDINFVQNETDGELYYTITNGGEAIMPSFKEAMDPQQRWHLVNYIKKELGQPK